MDGISGTLATRAGSVGIARPLAWLRRLGRLNTLSIVGIVGFALIIVVSLAAPLLAPYDPEAVAGLAFEAPSGQHLLGTDEVGRDLLSRVLYGARTSWFAAFVVICGGVLIGTAVGLLAGVRGGLVDSILMRATDAFLALPGPVLAIAIVAALGPSLFNTLLAVTIVWWPLYARVVRGEARSLMARPHVEAARVNGVSGMRLGLRHVAPGIAPPVIVAASLDVGALVLMLAALSFLGLGTPLPAAELGAMTASGLPYLLSAWWVPIMPALAVFLIAFFANLAGDGLRDLMEDR